MTPPTCPYCQGTAELVDSHTIYGHGRYPGKFWACLPCRAWVGTHRNSPKHAPLGRLANGELRDAKQMAHSAFDHLWQHHKIPRAEAYAWLAEAMGMPRGKCHIGWMDVEQCRKVAQLCQAELRRRIAKSKEQ